jgi:hypothetical protein
MEPPASIDDSKVEEYSILIKRFCLIFFQYTNKLFRLRPKTVYYMAAYDEEQIKYWHRITKSLGN